MCVYVMYVVAIKCENVLKIRGSVIFKECATKSSVFIQSNSGRNICLLSTIWRNSRYERPRIHFHPGPQVRHARRAVHCLKSVKTGNGLRAGGAFFWTVLFAAGQYSLPRFVRSLPRELPRVENFLFWNFKPK